jgi:hypothetical protein
MNINSTPHGGFSTPQQGSRFLYVESITEEQYKKWRLDNSIERKTPATEKDIEIEIMNFEIPPRKNAKI